MNLPTFKKSFFTILSIFLSTQTKNLYSRLKNFVNIQ